MVGVVMLEPKKTRTVRVNFRCWPTVGITTIYSFVTPNKPHRTTSRVSAILGGCSVWFVFFGSEDECEFF
jgi:hypothetical protein